MEEGNILTHSADSASFFLSLLLLLFFLSVSLFVFFILQIHSQDNGKHIIKAHFLFASLFALMSPSSFFRWTGSSTPCVSMTTS